MDIPKSHFVYEFAYPEGMPKLAGIIFYVGKGTSPSRMNDHFREAAREDCDCAKCKAIRSVWAIELAVIRNIVFTSKDEKAVLREEARRIVLHHSPYLTNIQHNQAVTSFSQTVGPTHEAVKRLLAMVLGISKDQITPKASLIEDFGADAIDLVQIVLMVEEFFNLSIPSGDMQRIDTVQELEYYLRERVDLGSSIYGRFRGILS